MLYCTHSPRGISLALVLAMGSACQPDSGDEAYGDTLMESQHQLENPPPPNGPPPPPGQNGNGPPTGPPGPPPMLASPPSPEEPVNRRQMRAAIQPEDDLPVRPRASACAAELLIDATGPALVFNDPEALQSRFSLSDILGNLIESSGGTNSNGVQQDLVASLLTSMNNEAYINSDSGITVNVDHRPTEASINPALFISDMLPVAVFNRLDLMSDGGSDCGEHRVIYSLDPNSSIKQAPSHKFTVIFEARYPNPNPDDGEMGCLPVAQFYAGLADPALSQADRAQQLRDFFLSGVTVNGTPLPPVIHSDHFQGPLGQVRTNQFVGANWQLREFRTSVNQGAVGFVPDTVKGSPMAELFNAQSSAALGITSLRNEFIDDLINVQLPLLLEPEINELTDEDDILVSFEPAFDNRFADFQSDSQGPLDNPSIQASPDLVTALDTALNNSGFPNVTSDQVLNRIGAMTCGGCHQFSANANVAQGVNWPALSTNFVHVNDAGTLSPALTNTFLPKRRTFLLEQFICLESDPECTTEDDCAPGLICMDGNCVDQAPECTDNDDCADGLICNEGICSEPEPECEAESDCAAGFICAEGICVEDPSCSSDDECPDELVCFDGECVNQEPNPVQCDDAVAILNGTGTASGNTTQGAVLSEGSCGGAGREQYVRLDAPGNSPICVQVQARGFTPVVYIRDSDCDEDAEELACAAIAQTGTQVQFQIQAGQTYFAFVDSMSRAGGRWRMRASRGRCRLPAQRIAN